MSTRHRLGKGDLRRTIPAPRRWLTAMVVAASAGPSWAAPPRHRVAVDARSFDLNAVAPPVPALTYQLVFDPGDRLPGPAATGYSQAALILTDDQQTQIDAADQADIDGDAAAFDRAMANLMGDHGRTAAVLARLDDAGRHDGGGLAAAWRHVGLSAVLPQLTPMRALANLLYVRARQQTRAGQAADAVATLRLGYRLAHDVSDGTPLVCGLVGLGIAAKMDEGLAKLMDRPDAPNLYWALATVPGPVVDVRRVLDGERQWQADANPLLARGRAADVPAAAWPTMADMAAAMAGGDDGPPAHPRPPTPAEAAEARAYLAANPTVAAYYARVHRVPVADAAGVDPAALIGTYFVGRFQEASDELYKWVEQPYPVLLPHVRDLPATLRAEGLEEGNLFAIAAPAYRSAIDAFARRDRTAAALTAVEAVRSYAAAHDGHLPAALADVTDTPVPANPITGLPFEYRVEAGVATLGDHSPLMADHPLEYTVRVRQPR